MPVLPGLHAKDLVWIDWQLNKMYADWKNQAQYIHQLHKPLLPLFNSC